jgi:5-methylcytosine-specific restriction endonuclease McrA
MPTARRRRCSWPPGCNVRVTRGGRCPAHREPGRLSARQRGYDGDWDAIARQVIAEEPICRRCGVNPSEVAGHILPLPVGTNARPNLRGLCRSCNAIEAAENRKGSDEDRIDV